MLQREIGVSRDMLVYKKWRLYDRLKTVSATRMKRNCHTSLVAALHEKLAPIPPRSAIANHIA